jgi:small subunit ribosomal protein S10
MAALLGNFRAALSMGPKHKVLTFKFTAPAREIIDPIVGRIARTAKLCRDLRVTGPVGMPLQRKKWTLLKSPFIDKKSREQLEQQTHTRLIIVEGDDLAVSRYLDFFKREETEAGISIRVTENTFFDIQDFYTPSRLTAPNTIRRAQTQYSPQEKLERMDRALRRVAQVRDSVKAKKQRMKDSAASPSSDAPGATRAVDAPAAPAAASSEPAAPAASPAATPKRKSKASKAAQAAPAAEAPAGTPIAGEPAAESPAPPDK